MTSRKIRLLLWAGCLGAVIYFAGDMLCYGGWGSGQFSPAERMAHVALWRLHLCSVTAPVGTGFYLLGAFGLWSSCRRAAPRLAALMLASLYADFLFGGLWHGMGGPLGFAIQHSGLESGAAGEIRKLMALSRNVCGYSGIIGCGLWIFLTLKKKSGVPRWTVFFCPLITLWLGGLVVYVPAPLGLPLAGGWGNISHTAWFAVLALTYKDGACEVQAGTEKMNVTKKRRIL
ncbi:MAG: hypothetical protein A2V45_12130 [Candidatus Aminicenantes bacterium RBG_19FT_COMBO_58_17]|nr:MAG: hypothetical protein A2V45_12130 [Candidatus Aminicenantes bacterium RBG_19FT_COMBO_58_17]